MLAELWAVPVELCTILDELMAEPAEICAMLDELCTSAEFKLPATSDDELCPAAELCIGSLSGCVTDSFSEQATTKPRKRIDKNLIFTI